MLCRRGIAIPLTDDHKAAREDETVRFPPHSVPFTRRPLFIHADEVAQKVASLMLVMQLSGLGCSVYPRAPFAVCPKPYSSHLQPEYIVLASLHVRGGSIMEWNPES